MFFYHCNLRNVEIQNDWTVKDCLVGHLSYCSHIHPDMNKAGLKLCSVDCKHKVTSSFTVEGETVEIYSYEDIPH